MSSWQTTRGCVDSLVRMQVQSVNNIALRGAAGNDTITFRSQSIADFQIIEMVTWERVAQFTSFLVRGRHRLTLDGNWPSYSGMNATFE
jgi:hypothetical protein